jgi:ParB family chromosome partitioning protein
MKEQIKTIAVSDLHPFPDNPFGIREDTELQRSIEDYGMISPLVVRPLKSGGYGIVSGHRRKAACEAAGIEAIPAFVREMDDTAAVIALVDSNLHREHILPSEKAFAYRMKLDAIRKQGQRADLSPDSSCGQTGHKSRDGIAEGESGRHVQRYIRLCELIPPILAMVDGGKIALSPAVELSYLTQEEQEDLFTTMESEDRTPSHAQAIRMRKLSVDGLLDIDKIFGIMTEEKPNQKEQIRLKTESIREFFPKGYSTRQMQDVIIRLLQEYHRKRERAERSRDAR